jgi:hypothetical protein
LMFAAKVSLTTILLILYGYFDLQFNLGYCVTICQLFFMFEKRNYVKFLLSCAIYLIATNEQAFHNNSKAINLSIFLLFNFHYIFFFF